MHSRSKQKSKMQFSLLILAQVFTTYIPVKMLLPLKWSRPANVPYPNVWLRFKAKDLDSDELVEYRIQDVPEDQIEEAIERLTEFYIPDEPLCKTTDSDKDPKYIRDFQESWRAQAAQRMVLACYKEGSDEILGVNLTYVASKDDDTSIEAKQQSQCKEFAMIIDLLAFVCNQRGFSVWDKYGVDKFVATFCLGVGRRFRGRGFAID